MFIYLILISLTSFFINASETTNPACAPADNDKMGDGLLLLDGTQSYYDEVTDGIILYISAPQRYNLQRLQFRGQAEISVDYPDGERSNVTITPGEETCMQRFLVNVPLGSLIWENMEVYFSTGRRSFYAVTMYMTVEETITVKSFTTTRSSELPLTFLLYLSIRTQLFPEIVKTEVDQAFEYYIDTKLAVRAAKEDGTSTVEIEFETGMNQPWEVKDFLLQDHFKNPDRVIPGSESLTMLTNECLGDRYEYNVTEGICIDENGFNSNAMYTDMQSSDDDICETVCNQLDECKAYDIYPHPSFMVCEVIGPAIPYLVEQGSWTNDQTPGYEWVHFYDNGGTPVKGDGNGRLATCYVKGAKTHFCTQTWRLEYEVNHVCGVEARHRLTLLAGLQYGNDLEAITQHIWVFYNPTCAKVIDTLTLVGELNLYEDDEFSSPSIVFRQGNYVYGRLNFTDRPYSGITVNDFSFDQNGETINAMDNRFALETLNEASGVWDFRFMLPLDALTGSIKGLSTSMTIDLTVQFSGMLNVGRRLLIKQDLSDDAKTAVFNTEMFILFQPCANPTTLVGRIHKETCSGNDDRERIRLCTKDGWNEVKSCSDKSNSALPMLNPTAEMVQMDSSVLVFGLVLSGLMFYGAWDRKYFLTFRCPPGFKTKEKV